MHLKQQALTAAQQEVEAAHAAHAALADEKLQREEELAGRLAAVQDECRTLLAVVEQAEGQQAEVGAGNSPLGAGNSHLCSNNSTCLAKK